MEDVAWMADDCLYHTYAFLAFRNYLISYSEYLFACHAH